MLGHYASLNIKEIPGIKFIILKSLGRNPFPMVFSVSPTPITSFGTRRYIFWKTGWRRLSDGRTAWLVENWSWWCGSDLKGSERSKIQALSWDDLRRRFQEFVGRTIFFLSVILLFRWFGRLHVFQEQKKRTTGHWISISQKVILKI